MSKYADLSDFEINKMVAERRDGVTVAKNQHLDYGDRDDRVVIVNENKHGNGTCVDYCNSWEDAGPLMVENGISLIWNWAHEKHPTATGVIKKTKSLGEYKDPVEIVNPNPCRAIAECYLMMKDGES